MLQSSGIEVVAPAKVNFFLGITGQRQDGFHSLVSLVVQLGFGDSVQVGFLQEGGSDVLHVEGGAVDCPVRDNLAWKALQAFRGCISDVPPIRISLTKRIPSGAGLGGGSSDAVAVLKGVNGLCGNPLGVEQLFQMAKSLGSDCPLFLERGPSIIRGRGDVVAFLPECNSLLAGARLLLFRPFCPVNTARAYENLREKRAYLSPREAEMRLAECLDSLKSPDFCLYNTFERIVFPKIPGLELVIERLRSAGIVCSMSGSGSACFAIIREDEEAKCVRKIVRGCWGERAFIVETSPLS